MMADLGGSDNDGLHYRGTMAPMALPQSKVTAQGQISVPAEIRRKLGIVPGTVLEWEEDGNRVIVRKKGKYTFEDIHKRLFPNGPPARRSDEEIEEGIRDYIRKKHGRR